MAYWKKIKNTNAVPVLKDELVFDQTPTVNSTNPVTSDGVARAIAGASGEVPVVTENDNGKILTAIYDEGGAAVEWAKAPDGVPEYSTTDEGKVLGVVVDSTGDTPVAGLDWVETDSGASVETTGAITGDGSQANPVALQLGDTSLKLTEDTVSQVVGASFSIESQRLADRYISVSIVHLMDQDQATEFNALATAGEAGLSFYLSAGYLTDTQGHTGSGYPVYANLQWRNSHGEDFSIRSPYPIAYLGDDYNVVNSALSAVDIASWDTDHVFGRFDAGTNMYFSLGNANGLPVLLSTNATGYRRFGALTEGGLAVTNPVPAPGNGDSGKVLTVNNNSGAFGWAAAPTELPSVTGNAGKVLQVNGGGTGVEWASASTVTSGVMSGNGSVSKPVVLNHDSTLTQTPGGVRQDAGGNNVAWTNNKSLRVTLTAEQAATLNGYVSRGEAIHLGLFFPSAPKINCGAANQPCYLGILKNEEQFAKGTVSYGTTDANGDITISAETLANIDLSTLNYYSNLMSGLTAGDYFLICFTTSNFYPSFDYAVTDSVGNAITTTVNMGGMVEPSLTVAAPVPAYAAGDAGKVLQVNAGGTGTQWTNYVPAEVVQSLPANPTSGVLYIVTGA